MTYSELLFIKAEAAERGSSRDRLRASTRRRSRRRWSSGASRRRTSPRTSRRPGVAYNPGADGIKKIAYEKWVSLYNLETEACAEFRRLDFRCCGLARRPSRPRLTRMTYPTSRIR